MTADHRALDVVEILELSRGTPGSIRFEDYKRLGGEGWSDVAAWQAFYRLRRWVIERGGRIDKRTADRECRIEFDQVSLERLVASLLRPVSRPRARTGCHKQTLVVTKDHIRVPVLLVRVVRCEVLRGI